MPPDAIISELHAPSATPPQPLLSSRAAPPPSPAFAPMSSRHAHAGERQVHHEASEALAALFGAEGRQVLRHSSGHLIPCTRSQVDEVRGFLSQFL